MSIRIWSVDFYFWHDYGHYGSIENNKTYCHETKNLLHSTTGPDGIDLRRDMYIYLSGGNWIFSAVLPVQFDRIDLRYEPIVELDSYLDDPFYIIIIKL